MTTNFSKILKRYKIFVLFWEKLSKYCLGPLNWWVSKHWTFWAHLLLVFGLFCKALRRQMEVPYSQLEHAYHDLTWQTLVPLYCSSLLVNCSHINCENKHAHAGDKHFLRYLYFSPMGLTIKVGSDCNQSSFKINNANSLHNFFTHSSSTKLKIILIALSLFLLSDFYFTCTTFLNSDFLLELIATGGRVNT